MRKPGLYWILALCIGVCFSVVGSVAAYYYYYYYVLFPVTLSLELHAPNPFADFLCGEIVDIYDLASPDEAEKVVNLRREHENIKHDIAIYAVERIIDATSAKLERRIELHSRRCTVRLRRGLKLIVYEEKAFGWAEVVDVQSDAKLVLDRSNAVLNNN